LSNLPSEKEFFLKIDKLEKSPILVYIPDYKTKATLDLPIQVPLLRYSISCLFGRKMLRDPYASAFSKTVLQYFSR